MTAALAASQEFPSDREKEIQEFLSELGDQNQMGGEKAKTCIYRTIYYAHSYNKLSHHVKS